MNAPLFIPSDFVPPRTFATQRFRLEVLHPRHNLLDHDAVMSSEPELHTVFAADHDWPVPGMTLAENEHDLRLHYAEFEQRQGFTYTILTPGADRCIGCLYIYPARLPAFDCEAFFWLRTDARAEELAVFATLRNWLRDAWPFRRAIWPGRDVPWSQWRAGPRRDVGADLP